MAQSSKTKSSNSRTNTRKNGHRLESEHECETIQLDEFEPQKLERKSGEGRKRLPVEVARTEPECTEPQWCRLDRRHDYR